jgi:hypothetical protein
MTVAEMGSATLLWRGGLRGFSAAPDRKERPAFAHPLSSQDTSLSIIEIAPDYLIVST